VRRQSGLVLYVLALVVVVVGADVLFFRHQFWDRLLANVGIVVISGAIYVRFLKRRSGQSPDESAPADGERPKREP
jgi:hypothetical protein